MFICTVYGCLPQIKSDLALTVWKVTTHLEFKNLVHCFVFLAFWLHSCPNFPCEKTAATHHHGVLSGYSEPPPLWVSSYSPLVWWTCFGRVLSTSILLLVLPIPSGLAWTFWTIWPLITSPAGPQWQGPFPPLAGTALVLEGSQLLLVPSPMLLAAITRGNYHLDPMVIPCWIDRGRPCLSVQSKHCITVRMPQCRAYMFVCLCGEWLTPCFALHITPWLCNISVHVVPGWCPAGWWVEISINFLRFSLMDYTGHPGQWSSSFSLHAYCLSHHLQDRPCEAMGSPPPLLLFFNLLLLLFLSLSLHGKKFGLTIGYKSLTVLPQTV